MKITQRIQTDVLVIGAGAAGLRAALAAAEAGSKVLIVNKGPVGKSGITLTAAGGMQAPILPEDSPEQFFRDTVTGGYHLGDQNLVNVLAHEASESIREMERYGIQFVRRPNGDYSVNQFPGQSKPRNLFIKGGGIGLVSALVTACKRNEAITIMDDFFTTGLVKGTAPSSVAGALGLHLKTGALTFVSAKSVIMATGGCQWLWETNDCPADATGDGLVYAYRAGAKLVDLEMLLFYPSVIVYPPSLKGAFVHYEFLNDDILDGNIYDRFGEPVLAKPLPVRDQAMRLMAQAIAEGRNGPNGGLYWYVGDSPKSKAVVEKVLNTLQYNYIRSHGVDPASAKVEVAPGAHYLLGGIFINEKCETSVKGLFAAPECAGNFDGANRLAGSGITGTQVFGARAGLYAHNWAAFTQCAEYDRQSLEEETLRINRRLSGEAGQSRVTGLRQELRAAVQKYAGVIRDEEGLHKLSHIARDILNKLDKEQVSPTPLFNQPLMDILQLENMSQLAGIIAGSALLRTESRGHHCRADYPGQNDNTWTKHTLALMADGHARFQTQEVITIG